MSQEVVLKKHRSLKENSLSTLLYYYGKRRDNFQGNITTFLIGYTVILLVELSCYKKNTH